MFVKFKKWLQNFNAFVNDEPDFNFQPRHLQVSGHDLLVRKARPKSADQMLAVERAIYHATPWPIEAFAIELDQRSRLYLEVIDEGSGQLVAFAGLSVNPAKRDSHITNIGVHPAYQRHGIGRFLMRTLMQVSVRLKMNTMSLEVKRANHTAQHLYQQLGFETARLRRHYYQDDGDDAYEMIVQLNTMKGIEHE